MKNIVLTYLFAVLFISQPANAVKLHVASQLEDCNFVSNSPSDSSFGSMPLGNGDSGANVWVEPSGDLLLYVSKVDAFDAAHLLPKLGRVRVTMQPAPSVVDFKQTLVLRDGSIQIHAGNTRLKVWVDANQPVIRIEGTSNIPMKITVTAESLRKLNDSNQPLPAKGTAGVLFTDQEPRLAWCYRNITSEWANRLASQNTPEFVAKAHDPILNRTSGCVVTGAGLVRDTPTSLVSKESVKKIDVSIRVLSNQPDSVRAWLRDASAPVASDWEKHKAYWAAFWDRSYIYVTKAGEGKYHLDQCRFTQYPQGSKAYEGHKEIDSTQNAWQITQKYALERFCEAAASRGAVPPPYNGSIFTMDMPAGVKGFKGAIGKPVSPDGRDWANLSFMWQNTRHPYWSMAARGDYDAIKPGMQFVRDGLDICEDRCKKIFGFDGAFIMEASWWGNVGVFNWDRNPAHLKYHQLATVETASIMAEYYEHTRDKAFLNDVLLPCADLFILYYENRFPKRDAKGKMLMEGVGCAETYQGVTNPCTEIGALKYLLGKLVAFEIDEARKSHWTKLLSAMPDVPTRRIRGLDLLAVGDVYNPGRVNCESPELYSIYPFKQVWLGKPELLNAARQSFHVRTISIDGTNDGQGVETGGWQSAPVQAAYLGLAREAARLVSINFNDQFIDWHDNLDETAPFPNRPRPTFPAFWECKMDGTPDNDHGANSANALQSMLLQSDGDKIFLLPAWPEDWDVSFKLHAAHNTTVECVYRDGLIEKLKVSPESRLKDVVDLSSYNKRVQTLVSVACNDRNYLFGLPPMLDAQAIPGKVTGPWISKYAECFAGTRAGPWQNCVYKDDTIYAFGFNAPAVQPEVDAKLISQTWLTDQNAQPVSILKLKYDRNLDSIAQAAPAKGSLLTGKTLQNNSIDLGKPISFNRVEFVIDNPGHRRGESKPFTIEAQQPDGSWKVIVKQAVFGNIFGKRFPSETAQNIRLTIDAKVLSFDVFND